MPFELVWIVLAVVAVLLASYGFARRRARLRRGAILRRAKPWQEPTLRRWVESQWLPAELLDLLPEGTSTVELFDGWARIDPATAAKWRFRSPLDARAPLEMTVAEVWNGLDPAAQSGAIDRLREALLESSSWWGGAERGWNGRPLVVLRGSLGKSERSLPLIEADDLTGAPLPSPFATERVLSEAAGPDLVVILAASARVKPRFSHPLAPRQERGGSLVAGLSSRVASDVGRRVGAGLGAALGPIGSLVGQYLGEIAGRMGGEALARQAVPDNLGAALARTEEALADLGKLAETDDFARAAQGPVDQLAEHGKRLDALRQDRRTLLDRIWPSSTATVMDDLCAHAEQQIAAHQAGAEAFVRIARKGPAAVTGGLILQNPWLVRRLPGGVERLNAARQALNGAARELMRGPTPGT